MSGRGSIRRGLVQSRLMGCSLSRPARFKCWGFPLGSDEFVADYVGSELLPVATRVMGKLAAFEDSQMAMYLLRVSYGIIRANHFMRTTPLAQWAHHAKKFDQLARTATEKILKAELTAEAYEQACVSPRAGGFGIRRASDHAPAAFNASWFAGKARCGENWAAPIPDMPSSATSQSQASEAIDKAIGSVDGSCRQTRQTAPLSPELRARQRMGHCVALRNRWKRHDLASTHFHHGGLPPPWPSGHKIYALPSLPAHLSR